MKTIVKGADLSAAVMKVVKAISVKTPSVLLEGIKLSCKGDSLVLFATDMEISIEATIKADTFMEGEAVVPGKLFSEFVKKLESEEDIELSLTDEMKLKITYGEAFGSIQAMSAEDFPVIKREEAKNSFSIKQKDLRDIINKTVFCCAVDASRPALRGCLFEVADNKLTAVALDGFRLALCRKNVSDVFGYVKAIVPSRGLNEIVRLIEGDDEVVTVAFQEEAMVISIGDTVFMTRTFKESFPDYNRILPSAFSTVFKTNKNILLSSVERASIVARGAKNTVKFDVKENSLGIYSDSEFGNLDENLLINLEGKDLTIYFNCKFILDALRSIDDDFVTFNLNSSLTPCVIRPTGENDDDYLYLILPLKI